MHNEKSQEACEICVSDFCRKDFVEGEWVIVGPKMKNSGSAIKDIFTILHNKRGENAHEN